MQLFFVFINLIIYVKIYEMEYEHLCYLYVLVNINKVYI